MGWTTSIGQQYHVNMDHGNCCEVYSSELFGVLVYMLEEIVATPYLRIYSLIQIKLSAYPRIFHLQQTEI